MLKFLLCKAQSGVVGFGLFGGGVGSGGITAVMDKYTYNTDVVSVGTSLSVARYQHAAVGNLEIAIFSGGSTNPSPPVFNSTVDKYQHSSNSRTTGTSFGGLIGVAAAGNSVFGLFGGGYNSSFQRSNNCTKYTYSTDVVTAGTFFGTSRYYHAATGNDQIGIFGGGEASSTTAVTEKYAYNTNTVSGGTSLGTARYGLAATGNTTVGIFGGGISAGYSSVTDKYTYSGDTRVAGTSLGTARRYMGAAGNSTLGIFGGGDTGSYTAVTDKYTYSGDTRVAGTSLGTARYSLAACSSTPGHF